MSFKTFRLIADANIFLPNEKLVLFQLASFQNEITKRCNPSPERIAFYTRLSASQVRSIIKKLENKQVIERTHNGWEFQFPQIETAQEIEDDWWPSEIAIDALLEQHPNHDFDMKEAVNDFIEFTNSNGLKIAPERRDSAFIRNISHILSHRKAGRAKIKRDGGTEKPSSILSEFFGRD